MREKKRFEQRRDALRSSAREKDGKKIALGDVPTRANAKKKRRAPFEGGRPNRAEIWSGGSRARTKG